MSKKTVDSAVKTNVVVEVDPLECPFREFRDNELQIDTWGMAPAAFRAHIVIDKNVKTPTKSSHDGHYQPWVDDQTQPLPRSVRCYLHGWIRAEQLSMDRWNAEVVIFDENDGGKMSVTDVQLSHAQVLFRSSFCRRVLSACFLLERVESLIVEHQWELFTCNFGTEGWRPKYHIYSPGLKPGGGTGHKPVISKNGCYLVRLYYLGAWRCVWVSDQVPVDASGAPLLPFSPLLTHPPAKPGSKHIHHAVMASVVHLWPLLLTKALLKLAAPDMNSDEDTDSVEDELMKEFDIIHCLTGGLNMRYYVPDIHELWKRIITEVPQFSWDDDDETQASTVKTKSTKKPTAKDAAVIRRNCFTYAIINDTKEYPPYHLPGITPGHEMCLLIHMARDLPLKKPLPEPEVALWKYYRWVDWARQHGLYEAYDCPRTKFLKVNGLMKLSYAPHLLDVESTESITLGFIEEHVKSNTAPGGKDDDETMPFKKKEKKPKEQQKTAVNAALQMTQQMKEELREWIQFKPIHPLVKCIQVVYYPSMFGSTSAGSNPPIRVTKAATTKVQDIQAPKLGPLYLQLDGPEENKLRMSLSTLHPRILTNTGVPVLDFIEPAHMVLEEIEWFNDTALPLPKAYIKTRGYETVEINFPPGRHFFRIWTHSRMHWHIMLISESTMVLGTRDIIQCAAVRECPWSSKFLLNLGAAFSVWIKVNRSRESIFADREFFRAYLPDLPWDDKVIGYNRAFLHWMFRQALQNHLSRRLNHHDWKACCKVLRKYLCDPDFGFPPKPKPPRSLREIANLEICDCVMPEVEETELIEEQVEETDQVHEVTKPLVEPHIMDKLLKPPKPPIVSQVCELATEELPCGILKDEREKIIKKHEAAVVLQSHWRGRWARKCLDSNVVFTPDVTKYMQDHAFGNLEVLASLMNEFFGMFPGTKYAYSVASGLSGVYGLHQHSGTTQVTPNCKWVPYFQGVFYCHAAVKVHFDVQSSIAQSTLTVYDNDTGLQLPQAYNTHVTFDFQPNFLGYTVQGHGSLKEAPGIQYDAYWQLTVMSCYDAAFHICDNEDPCKEVHLPHSYKLHIDEIFIPNRRNILGGIHISVTKHESVSFRAAATSPDLEMEAILRTILPGGFTEELGKCSGKGEIYWPYISLEPATPHLKLHSTSHGNVSGRELAMMSTRSLHRSGKPSRISPSSKMKSSTKMKVLAHAHEPKHYSIEVVCPQGWPLTLVQWRRVDEVRNTHEVPKVETTAKKATKEKEKTPKPGSGKEKDKMPAMVALHQPQPGDASVELECALATGGGAAARRNDERDLEFTNARKLWDAKDHGRNQRGAQIRKEFRNEFLEAPPAPTTESNVSFRDDAITDATQSQKFHEANMFEGAEYEEEKKSIQGQGPSPASESGMIEMSVESEEEALYLTMPDQLRDKFVPLYFVPLCWKENPDEPYVVETADMVEAAKMERHERIEAAMNRMRELQVYNEEHVLGRQRYRCQLLEKLFVDGNMCPQLVDVMDQRDEAIAQEVLNRNLSATRKKQEAKKK